MSTVMNGNVEKSERRKPEETPRASRRVELARVVNQIDTLCEAFGVGARIPAHRDLMTRFGTTERTVLHALAELQRRGRIVRRAGSGTYVASQEGVHVDQESSADETGNRSDTISSLVVVASHDHGYYSRAIEMAFRHAQEQDLDVTFEPPNFERLGTITRARGNQIGLLVIGSQYVHDAREIYTSNSRIVGVGDWRLIDRIPFACVFPDNVRGGYMAASHLIEQGHTNLAYLAAGDNPRLWGHEHAVRHAQESGSDVQSAVIGRETFNEWQRNPSVAKAFFASPDSPTGFCTWNDTDAISLMTLLMSIGLHVPNDISIVGYDDLPVSQTITPALTTVDTHLEDQVKLAIAQIVSHDDLPHHSIVVDPDLIIRASTKSR